MAKDELNEVPSMDEAPWLIGVHKNKNPKLEKQTFFTINNNTSYVKKIVELHRKSIIGSSMGWLILRDRVKSKMYSLWNPITRQSIILPELLDTPRREPEWCMLTSPPYEDGFDNAATRCVLFLIFVKGLVFWCRPTTTTTWVKQCLMLDGLSVNLNKVVTLNGDLYAYAHTHMYHVDEDNDDDDYDPNNNLFIRLKVCDVSTVLIEPLSVVRHPLASIEKWGPPELLEEISYFVEVCGDLYVVSIIPRQVHNLDGYDILKAFVWRLDLSKMEWIQVESLGDRSLLLSSRCCTWCWAYESHGRIEGNCIYMAEFQNDIIHQYRLQDNSYTFVSSHSNFGSCSHGPIWFMPHNPTRFSSFLIKEAEEAIVELREETSVEMPASLLLQLPSDMMILIADRMHWFDCMNYRATCKMMRSEIPKPQWKANSPFPLFMFLSNTQGICELWDPCYQNNGSITKKLPYSTSIVSTIEFCKDDWLMMRMRSHEDDEGFYLQYMNIFTGEKGKYPIPCLPYDLSSFAFSTCPTSPDCLTFGISRVPSYYITIGLFQAGHDRCWEDWEHIESDDDAGHDRCWEDWEHIEFHDDAVDFKSDIKSSPKYHDGAFYFLGENGILGILKLIDGDWDLETHKGPLQNDDASKLNECYIAELDGQLVCVFIQAFGFGIQVYNFDINQKLWVELKSLGDYTLFVSAASSISVPTKDSSMRNRIYLPKRIGNEMVFYSLDTGKYHISSSKDSFENFCGMNSQSFCCWV